MTLSYAPVMMVSAQSARRRASADSGGDRMSNCAGCVFHHVNKHYDRPCQNCTRITVADNEIKGLNIKLADCTDNYRSE